ncbi:hypothetical protein V497_08736 [Pseudogymnoascus sp. VKM F-4516 (FW-969)]|nr:hypothetical protein V497_08736 [Pseudogymnoascus sp. VKM F-4516 (FW-969)]
MAIQDITKLAAELSAQAKVLQDYLEANKLEGLSLDKDAPVNAPFDPANLEIQGARAALLQTSQLIHDLVAGPKDLILERAMNTKFDIMVLHAVTRFGIADAVPLDEPIAFEDLAKKVGLSTDRVTRLLRYGITNNLFEEPRPGYVGHSGLSSVLVREPHSRSMVLHCFEEIVTSKFIEAYDRFGESEEPNETAAHVAFKYFEKNPKDNLWTFFANDGEGEKKGYRMNRFAEAMTWAAGMQNNDHMDLIQGFDWAGLGEGTVVDVGGSVGHCSIAIAKKSPNLKFIVQDFPALQPAFEASLPSDLKSRVSFQPHDFFTPQPVKADVYFLRFILHDYSDPYAIKILRNLIPALEKGSRLVICDIVLPPAGAPVPPQLVRLMRSVDLQMMVGLNSKERSEEQWVDLLARADSRFKLVKVAMVPALHSLIEVRFD